MHMFVMKANIDETTTSMIMNAVPMRSNGAASFVDLY